MTTTARFDDLIHAPTRLSIVSLLGASDWADFKFIRESLGLSDSALSKQLTLLEGAGYIEIRKGFVGKRPRTWARLSKAGQRAFEGHVQKLQEIVSASGMTIAGDGAAAGVADRRSSPEPGTQAARKAAMQT
jgi:DNA-binding transcriptional ArsR family regulator